jgi:hypothetical protein
LPFILFYFILFYFILFYFIFDLKFFLIILGDSVMKFISLVLFIFLSLAVTNSYSIFTERYAPHHTYAGDEGISVSGDYSTHTPEYDLTSGLWLANEVWCKQTDNLCYESHYTGTWVEFTFYNWLPSNPPPTGPFVHTKVYMDSTGFHVQILTP